MITTYERRYTYDEVVYLLERQNVKPPSETLIINTISMYREATSLLVNKHRRDNTDSHVSS